MGKNRGTGVGSLLFPATASEVCIVAKPYTKEKKRRWNIGDKVVWEWAFRGSGAENLFASFPTSKPLLPWGLHAVYFYSVYASLNRTKEGGI